MSNQRMDNARDPEQLRIMMEHQKAGVCHFCPEGFKKHKSPVIYDDEFWFITGNDYAYPGSVSHYLIVSKQHVTKVQDLSISAQLTLFTAIEWLSYNLGFSGFSLFVRSGNMAYTGATLDHLHFHFLVGEEKSDNTEMLLVNLGYKKK